MSQTAAVSTKRTETGAMAGIRVGIAVSSAAAPVFLILNALKITLFNVFLLQRQTAEIFTYKLAVTLLVVLAVYPLIYAARSKALMITLYVIQCLYIAVNTGYYLYFRSYLHLSQYFLLFGEAFSMAGKSAIPLNAKMLVALIDAPVFISLLFSRMEEGRGRFMVSRAAICVMCVSVLILSGIETVNVIRKNSIVNLVRDTFSGESPIVERYGTVANSIVTQVSHCNFASFSLK